ncbi:DUF397 domain-containing protein [Streptomyces sp. NPDC058861]|uniref:DUF397 domain-containing protein n=1 Tax=Streptomyces sp. NPDC058861 TaxID=3346653 RepID=UPI00367B53E0
MREYDLTRAHWFKGSYSNASGGDRVEVLDDVPGVFPVRDSKNPGPVLVVRADARAAFVGHLAG